MRGGWAHGGLRKLRGRRVHPEVWCFQLGNGVDEISGGPHEPRFAGWPAW